VDNEDQVLNELSEYLGKSGGFAKKYLWDNFTSKPINWWNLLDMQSILVKDLHNNNVEVDRDLVYLNNQEARNDSENNKIEVLDDDNITNFSNRLINMFNNGEYEFDEYLSTTAT
ncbi:4021_t:CDS:2, partial [Scutellospora calospora]